VAPEPDVHSYSGWLFCCDDMKSTKFPGLHDGSAVRWPPRAFRAYKYSGGDLPDRAATGQRAPDLIAVMRVASCAAASRTLPAHGHAGSAFAVLGNQTFAAAAEEPCRTSKRHSWHG
jgi:hypothetical protein